MNELFRSVFNRVYPWLIVLSGCTLSASPVASGPEQLPRFSAKLIAKIRMIELDQGQCSPALRAALEHGEAVVHGGSPAE